MRCIGKGALGVLMLAGIGGCSDMTVALPTAEAQQAMPVASYVATADMTIAAPDAGFGSLPVCGVHGGIPGGAAPRSCLMYWPIPSADITVASASLDLRVVDASIDTVKVYPLLKSFTEQSGTWTRASPTTYWFAPGAKGPSDRGPSVGEQVFSQTGDAVFTFNATGIQMVQSWFDNPSVNNQGIILENLGPDRVQFATREDGTLAFRPTLHINGGVDPEGDDSGP